MMGCRTRLQLLACTLGFVLHFAASQEVLVGTEANFAELVKTHEKALVEFYAPWCGHCKQLEPEYNEAAAKLHEQGLKTKLIKVDATVESSLAQEHGVSGYPTLKYFQNGVPEEYGGGRTASTILQWLRKREVDAFEVIKEDAVESFLAKAKAGEFSVVARVKKGSVRDKAFKAALSDSLLVDYEEATLFYALVYLPKGADAKKDSSLVMRRPGFAELKDEVDLSMPGAWSQSSVSKWIMQSVLPTVGKSFKSNMEFIEKLGYEAQAVFALDEDPSQEETVRDMARSVAAKYPKWNFVVTQVGDLKGPEEEMFQGAGGDDSIMVFVGSKKYRLQNSTGEMASEAKVLEFLEQVKAGKAKRHFKSADPPAKPVGEDNVVTLTGSTFDEYVMDTKKDVFVEFYAPWCGHCQKLAPEWSKLAETMKKEGLDAKGVVIAKMDATENECEEELGSYPTLVLYPAVARAKKMRSKLQYSGERSLNPLLDFLLENARNLEGVELKAGVEGKKKKKASKKEL